MTTVHNLLLLTLSLLQRVLLSHSSHCHSHTHARTHLRSSHILSRISYVYFPSLNFSPCQSGPSTPCLTKSTLSHFLTLSLAHPSLSLSFSHVTNIFTFNSYHAIFLRSELKFGWYAATREKKVLQGLEQQKKD